MNISGAQLTENLKAEMMVEAPGVKNASFDYIVACDMMSDLLSMMNHGGGESGAAVLLTGLTNKQVVRTAEMVDIKLIVFANGKRPLAETIELAERCGISLASTEYTMFRSCAILFECGMKDVGGSN
jgi:hypothetical protein